VDRKSLSSTKVVGGEDIRLIAGAASPGESGSMARLRGGWLEAYFEEAGVRVGRRNIGRAGKNSFFFVDDRATLASFERAIQ
jgi:hypothetical protein